MTEEDSIRVNWLIEAHPQFQTLLRVGQDSKTLFLEAVNLTRPARHDLFTHTNDPLAESINRMPYEP